VKTNQPQEVRQGLAPRDLKPVIVVGAGPVGLTVTIDLMLRGVSEVVILDEGDGPAIGSRAICWSRRTLEIMTRLGVGRTLVEHGVMWRVGRVYDGDEELFRFDLEPAPGYGSPAFINLSQNALEAALAARLADAGHPGIAWRHRVTGIEQTFDRVRLMVETPTATKVFDAAWVVAADGARSTLRRLLALTCSGREFEERFLIADVRTVSGVGNDRRFWFHPTFHRGHSALMHHQPGSVLRIDLQLGTDADPIEERKAERIIPRLERVLGDRSCFELVWASVYVFRCARLDHFVHDRVIFAGDSAHQMSPFGARGGNGGIQDVDNLAWKLALVVHGKARRSLLQSYDTERVAAADENILHSARATDFMSPRPGMTTVLRDAVLDLARTELFARALINSGRLSTPAVLDGSPLNGPDVSGFSPAARPGAACPDAPVRGEDGRPGWLLDRFGGGFVALYGLPNIGLPAPVAMAAARLRNLVVPIALAVVGEGAGTIGDSQGLIAERYGLVPGSVVLVRPDQHVAARFRAFDSAAIEAALARALGDDIGRQDST
jgi:3-(3-hydroxy-phenyl)propionate hydroxylase